MAKTDLKKCDLDAFEVKTERLLEGPSLFPREDTLLAGEIWRDFQEIKLEVELLRMRSGILSRLINAVNFWVRGTTGDQLRTAAQSMRAICKEWNDNLRLERETYGIYNSQENFVEEKAGL